MSAETATLPLDAPALGRILDHVNTHQLDTLLDEWSGTQREALFCGFNESGYEVWDVGFRYSQADLIRALATELLRLQGGRP